MTRIRFLPLIVCGLIDKRESPHVEVFQMQDLYAHWFLRHVLGTVRNVYISEYRNPGWDCRDFSGLPHVAQQGSEHELQFALPGSCLSSYIPVNLSCSFHSFGIVLCLCWTGVRAVGGTSFRVPDCWWGHRGEDVMRSTDSSKYLTKCHKGWHLHVVAWRGRNDWCAVRRWLCVSRSDGPGLLHGFE